MGKEFQVHGVVNTPRTVLLFIGVLGNEPPQGLSGDTCYLCCDGQKQQKLQPLGTLRHAVHKNMQLLNPRVIYED